MSAKGKGSDQHAIPKWALKYIEIMTALKLDITRDVSSPFIVSAFIKKCGNKPIDSLGKLAELLRRRKGSIDKIIVTGPGPSLKFLGEHEKVHCADCPIISADSSFYKVKSLVGRHPDVLITDLDGVSSGDLVNLLKKDVLAMVHVHGDNMQRVLQILCQISGENVVFTSQIENPPPPILGMTGFTDGDRSILASLSLGAREVVLVGMDYDLPPIPNGLRDMGADYYSYFKLGIGRSIATKYICKAMERGAEVKVLSYFSVDCGKRGL